MILLLETATGGTESCEHLKELLKVASGGIVFTTIQKFIPDNDSSVYELLSEGAIAMKRTARSTALTRNSEI